MHIPAYHKTEEIGRHRDSHRHRDVEQCYLGNTDPRNYFKGVHKARPNNISAQEADTMYVSFTLRSLVAYGSRDLTKQEPPMGV